MAERKYVQLLTVEHRLIALDADGKLWELVPDREDLLEFPVRVRSWVFEPKTLDRRMRR